MTQTIQMTKDMKFAPGMRMQRDGIWYIVRWVDLGGNAHASYDPDNGMGVEFASSQIETFILDLDSVWVGRKYEGRVTKRECEIVLVSSEWIGFTGTDGQEGLCPRDQWDQAYKVLPLPLPESVAPEPWRPKVGKTCLQILGSESYARRSVVPIVYDITIEQWVCRIVGDTKYVPIPESSLKSLPPEPPVGDGVTIERAGICFSVNHCEDNDTGVARLYLRGVNDSEHRLRLYQRDAELLAAFFGHLIARPEASHE